MNEDLELLALGLEVVDLTLLDLVGAKLFDRVLLDLTLLGVCVLVWRPAALCCAV